MREIIFDMHTTGDSAIPMGDDARNHRIIELGAVELVDLKPTGRFFHKHITPELDPDKSWQHNPNFSQIADQWLDFIGDTANLITHHTEPHTKLLNAELKRVDKPPIDPQRFVFTHTLPDHTYPTYHHNLSVMGLLSMGADINAKNPNGEPPLFDINYNRTGAKNIGRIHAIINAGADVNSLNQQGQNVLHIACQSHNPRAVNILINAGTRVDVADKNGNTPLHCAVHADCIDPNDKQDTIKALLDAGADIHAKNKNGNIPLTLCTTAFFND